MPVSSFQMQAGAAALLLATAALGQVAVNPAPPGDVLAPAKTVEELEARYAAVLMAMKDPPATGILVAELGPYSAGGRAGLRPGDVLTEYEGVRLDNRADKNRAEMLRVAVAKAVNGVDRPGANPQVALIVRRRGKTMVITADRQPLGIRALAVEAGVGLPANPPATPRGSFALEWTPAQAWFHVGDVTGPYGAEKQEFSVIRLNATLNLATRVVNSSGKVIADAQAAAIQMTVSDRTASYGMWVDRFTYRDELSDVTAARRGGVVKGAVVRRLTGVKQEFERPTLPEAVCSLAIPYVAAALPQKAGVVLPLSVISEMDLQTRLGYALETRGKAAIKITGEDAEGYSVRLWHLGQIEATFFFRPTRELIYAEHEAGVGGVKLRRAEDEAAAIKGMAGLSATRAAATSTTAPASAPATRKEGP